MAKTSLDTSREWDLIYTSHGNNFLSNKVTDQFYDDYPFLKYLRSKAMPAKGGQRLIVPVGHGTASDDNARGPYTAGQQFALVDQDPTTVARYDWAYYRGTVLVDATEEHEAGGAGARLNMVQTKISDEMSALMAKLSDDVNATTQVTNGIIPLDDLVPVDPTSGTVGGINRANESWWRSKTDDSGTTFSTGGLDAMRTMFNNTTFHGSSPDLVYTTQTVHEAYEDLVEGTHDITTGAQLGTGRKGDLGFGGGLFYKGVPFVWDRDAATPLSGRMFMLNSKGIQLVESKGRAFKMEPFQNLLPAGLHARGAIVTWWGQLVLKEARLQGQISQIT